MKCERCAGYAETAADVRACVTCVQDGTAAQIPAAIADSTALESLCLPDTGLANRFKPGTRPAEPASESEAQGAHLPTSTQPGAAPKERARPGPKPGSHHHPSSKKK